VNRWLTIFAAPVCLAAALAAQEPVDLLIAGGTVYDGSGGTPFIADVGIRGDRIVFLGDAGLAGIRAARTLDAARRVVAPGFIDPHTHVDGDLRNPATRGLVPFLLQGVTTVISGNDGGGPVDVGAALRRLEGGAGTNVAFLVGHGSIRRVVLGMSDRAPSPTELARMGAMVAQAMADGAIGLSTGLYYAPGSYATTEEVIELARVAGAAGGYYDSHIRDESSYTIGLLGAVDETIRIGREAGVPVHFAHLKALGVDVWGQSDAVVARILAARAAGLRVTADQYPYTASGTGLGASLLPRWAEAGGRDSLLRRLADPAIAARLEKEMAENLRRRGGAGSLLITGEPAASPAARARMPAGGKWKGKRLAALASELGLEPVKAAIAIIQAGDAGIASFNMSEADLEHLMRQDFVVTGSDGSDGHPRKYGTFPKKIASYVREKGVISLARMIQASSAQTADLAKLTDRGRVEVGRLADLIVFDSATVADRSTYEQPERLAVGMETVIVNGRVVVTGGRPIGALAGRPLRRGR